MMEKYTIDEQRLKDVEYNYKKVLDCVQNAVQKASRRPDDVRLMAVTKTVEPAYINRVIDLGADLIGENRVQEYMAKKDDLKLDRVEKHLIGRLQTNKVKYIIGQVDMIESVDSVKLAGEVSRLSSKHGVTTNVLVEVNLGREESKSGIYLENLEELLDEISCLDNICVKGLMTVPPICDNETQVRRYFETLHQSFIDIKSKNKDNINMQILSMGMSGDYEAAIAEGSNIVRIGSAIFGQRKYF